MHLLQSRVNLVYIRDLLGHADVSTTEVYARATSDSNVRRLCWHTQTLRLNRMKPPCKKR